MIQHIMVRGVDRMELFRDEMDRAKLATRIAFVLSTTDVCCLVWAFMLNHIHMLLRSGLRTSTGKFMQRVFTSYTMYFNRKYGRVGMLVQNRFKSKHVGDDVYLHNAIPYVTRNPSADGQMSLERLEWYPWTSTRALLHGVNDGITDVETTLRIYGSTQESGREALRTALRDFSPETHREIERDFDQTAIVHDVSMRSKADDHEDVLASLVNVACELYPVRPEDFIRGRRPAPVSRARALVAALGATKFGVPQRVIGDVLGVTPGAVSLMLPRGLELIHEIGRDRLEGMLVGVPEL